VCVCIECVHNPFSLSLSLYLSHSLAIFFLSVRIYITPRQRTKLSLNNGDGVFTMSSPHADCVSPYTRRHFKSINDIARVEEKKVQRSPSIILFQKTILIIIVLIIILYLYIMSDSFFS